MQFSAEQKFRGARSPDETIARAYNFADLSSYPFKQAVPDSCCGSRHFSCSSKVLAGPFAGEIGWMGKLGSGDAQRASPHLHVLAQSSDFLPPYFLAEARHRRDDFQSFDGEYIARVHPEIWFWR